VKGEEYPPELLSGGCEAITIVGGLEDAKIFELGDAFVENAGGDVIAALPQRAKGEWLVA
jgi:hypothetical protein